MTDISAVSLSTQQLAMAQPQVVRESVEFYAQFKGQLAGDLKALSSGTRYPNEPADVRERLLALIGMIDTA